MTAVETSSKNLRTWTMERVTLLRSCFNAGLSCAQIANEIGVSRNAVIGKINRLGLSRGKSSAAPRTRSTSPMQRSRVSTARPALRAPLESESVATDVVSAEPCSLLDLAPRKCRWPISANGAAALSFCGNITADGMSYCIGHVRMAYRFSTPRSGNRPPAQTRQVG